MLCWLVVPNSLWIEGYWADHMIYARVFLVLLSIPCFAASLYCLKVGLLAILNQRLRAGGREPKQGLAAIMYGYLITTGGMLIGTAACCLVYNALT